MEMTLLCTNGFSEMKDDNLLMVNGGGWLAGLATALLATATIALTVVFAPPALPAVACKIIIGSEVVIGVASTILAWQA